MSMFSLVELMDVKKRYQAACKEIVYRRIHALLDGLGLELPPNPLYDGYYGLIDFSSGRAKTSARMRWST